MAGLASAPFWVVPPRLGPLAVASGGIGDTVMGVRAAGVVDGDVDGIGDASGSAACGWGASGMALNDSGVDMDEDEEDDRFLRKAWRCGDVSAVPDMVRDLWPASPLASWLAGPVDVGLGSGSAPAPPLSVGIRSATTSPSPASPPVADDTEERDDRLRRGRGPASPSDPIRLCAFPATR